MLLSVGFILLSFLYTDVAAKLVPTLANVKKPDKVAETAIANELQKFQVLIRYGHQVANQISKMIRILRN
ncbi:MAG TPA: hypothetical protein DCP36_16100 [Sporomusaceae bacterium]|nr:hypothetical protein [Sporomusaceae bacterium]